ncbi:MAG: cell division protein FtsK [Actinomycetales bacterium]|nr:MAG: cell division protein FtsK [Actinomycetales bacterium]
MKISVTLRQGDTAKNVIITADATATVGDVATAIASAGRDELIVPEDGRRLSLRLHEPITQRSTNLAPGTALVRSGVCSGSTIEVETASASASREAAGAILRVVEGPDRGIEVPLRYGSSQVGRTEDNDVRLRDPKASKNHARIVVGEHVEIIDNNSANGVVVGGQRASRVTLGPGDVALLGETRVCIEALSQPSGRAPATSNDIAFTRPPVVLKRPEPIEIDLPEIPEEQDPQSFPWLAMAAPLIMGVLLYLFTRSILSVIFIGLSPLLMIGNYVSTRIDLKRREKKALARFEAGLDRADSEMIEALEVERQQRLILYPSPSECVDSVFEQSPRLWSRRPEHPEFMQVRLGCGPIRPAAHFSRQSGGKREDLLARVATLRSKHAVLHDAPVVADLSSVGGIGIVGTSAVPIGVARAVAAQVAAMHSPSEVVVTCLTSTPHKPDWSWLEWLPHTRSPHTPIGGLHLAADAESARLVLDELEALVAGRLAATKEQEARVRGPLVTNEPQGGGPTPAVLVIIHEPVADMARMTALAERGPDARVHVLWVAERPTQIPAACRTYLDLGDGNSAHVGMVRSEQLVDPVATEALDPHTAATVARRLAPVTDAGVPVRDDSDLPRTVTVVSLLGHEDSDEPELVLGRWKENGSFLDRTAPPRPSGRAGDLRSVVGHTGTEPFTLDLRTQGPHALVGGTTGAGKSEFLQAWILGLAHAYSPDRVTFLFVDYKGGSAFALCESLPHAVGMVTDLSPYLVQRALRSLRAEIHYRERLLNAKGKKDLIELEKTGDPECPPSLIIIVDEFAALAGEVPEFVDGVIDIAQRGRSLGLHLIMATQRPAGVIKDSLRANTNLRIALRMNDEHDSTDVLGSPMAAHFDPAIPGRGAAKTGPGRITTFQSGFPGARTLAEPPAPPIQVAQTDFGMTEDWKVPSPKAVGGDVATDIERVVKTVTVAARLGGVPAPRRPWLDALASVYDLAKLNQRNDREIVLGVLDDPDRQAQVTEHFFPDVDGNILYLGSSGSGKSTALRSLAVASSITPRSGPVHVYALDFAGGALGSLSVLPNVGDVVGGDDTERVQRLIRMLTLLVEDRAERYAAARASSLTEYRKLANKADEPRVLLLLDGFGTFRDDFEVATDRAPSFTAFQRLLVDGRQVGVHVAMSGDRPSSVPASIAASFPRRIILRQADQDSYSSLGVPNNILTPDSPPGRGLQPEKPMELQIAILGGEPSAAAQARHIEHLAADAGERIQQRPARVLALPGLIAASSMPSRCGDEPTLGVSDTTLTPVGFDPHGNILIAGPPQSGRTRALQWFAYSIAAASPATRRVHLSARRSPLSTDGIWNVTVTGEADIEALLGKLELWAGAPAAGAMPDLALFLDGVPDMGGSMYESRLASVVTEARRNGHLTCAEGELSGWSNGWDLPQELKSTRTGMLLRPDQMDGDSLLRTALPRCKPSDFPSGRGYWIKGGNAWKVQLPLVE